MNSANCDKPSEIIKRKLFESGGSANIYLLNEKPCNVMMLDNGSFFSSDKLNKYNYKFEFKVFDDIVDFLNESPNKTAKKGNGHGKEDKVGYGKCTPDTVLGAIAIRYFKKSFGESTIDPVFVLAAILDWSGIAKNKRGYVELI